MPRRAAVLAGSALGLALAGEAGHRFLGVLQLTVAHHFFHLLYGGGAVLIFGLLVARDIRRHGWPQFSWRLDPDATRPARPRPVSRGQR